MEILNSFNPVVVTLCHEDVRTLHLALYDYKDGLKRNKALKKDIKRARLRNATKLIVLIDLLL